MDKNSLCHTTWECKYHLVFAPKYRRQVIYGQIKADVAEILSMLCKRKGIEIIEAECCKDHIHMLVRIELHYIGKNIFSILETNIIEYIKFRYHVLPHMYVDILFVQIWLNQE